MRIKGELYCLDFAIINFGEYSSNEEEIIHDGTILAKKGISYEDIKCKVSFDICIELTSGTKFTGNIDLSLPPDDITKNRQSRI